MHASQRDDLEVQFGSTVHNCGPDSTAGDGAPIAQASEWALVRPDRAGRANIKFRVVCT